MPQVSSNTRALTLEQGRDAFRRRAWADAYALLSAADRESPLPAEDLERLATAAHLTGRDAESAGLWARAHRDLLGGGAPQRAVRCAFWLALGLLERGEGAQANGWLARARRLLEGCPECAEQGYLLLPEALRRIAEGDSEGAALAFGRAAEIGERFGDADLVTLARHGQGRALIRLGRATEGVALLDEAMVAVTSGEVSPVVAGDVYCGVISGCHELFDWRRAREWTAALARWCAAQPDLVPYRGQCLLRRSEILQLSGEWSHALAEARRACERLAQPPGQAGLGAAFYQQAEVHRMRGDFALAEEAYREAGIHGRRPQPGLALLCLGRGDVEAALAAIRRAVEETVETRARPRLLAAQVEIALAAGEVPAARAAADELAALAAALGAPYLRALAVRAEGAVRLAEGDARAALAALREAEALWRGLEAPHEAARARELVAAACRALGDAAEADLELDAACATYRRVGAGPDLARAERLRRPAGGAGPGGLTGREVQVIRLVAAGKTNRGIAADLGISEKTVARHVSNIFVKLGLSSRAAATAYAYRHALVPPRPD